MIRTNNILLQRFLYTLNTVENTIHYQEMGITYTNEPNTISYTEDVNTMEYTDVVIGIGD